MKNKARNGGEEGMVNGKLVKNWFDLVWILYSISLIYL